MRTSAASAALLACATVAAADDEPIESGRRLVQTLVAEARQIVADDGPVAPDPDLADRGLVAMDAGELGNLIIHRAHRDPFVDAYVRWQLTSLDPGLPVMDDAAFLQMLSVLPPLLDNPRADEATIGLLERAEASGPLPGRDLARVREAVARLDAATAATATRNRAALGLRAWLEGEVAGNPLRRRLLLVEGCAATVRAGWSTREVKTRLTRALGEGVASLDPAERRRLADVVRRLGGERRFVNDVTFMASGAVQVTVSRAAVDRDDIDRWVGLLGE